MARDRKTQALLPLRGKILNVLGAASSKLGQNQEISDLCQALGTGMGTRFNLDDLRYDKVIIMTDADVDGAHIASLLMTFFFTQMRPLIDRGHLYLACPPLFRLTQGRDTASTASTRPRRTAWLAKGLGGQGQDRRLPLQGPGRDGRQGPQGHHDEPRHPQLIRVTIDEDDARRDRRSGGAADGQEAGTAVPVYPGECEVRGGVGCLNRIFIVLFVSGFLLTIAWVLAVILLFVFQSEIAWIEAGPLSLNEAGDFFAGAFGPPAILWIILGFIQQGRELRNSIETLRLQTIALHENVQQQQLIARTSQEQLELQIEEYSNSIARLKNSISQTLS